MTQYTSVTKMVNKLSGWKFRIMWFFRKLFRKDKYASN